MSSFETCLLLSLLECGILTWFLSPLKQGLSSDRIARTKGEGAFRSGKRTNTPADILILAAGTFCMYFSQRGAFPIRMPLYGLLAEKWLTAAVFSWLWCRCAVMSAFFYGTIFFLICDSSDILFSFFSQKLAGQDLFMSGHAVGRVIYCLALAAVIFLYAALLRYILKKRWKTAISPMLAVITVISMTPYLFIRGIVEWLPLKNEDLSFEIPVMLMVTSATCLITTIGIVSMLGTQQELFEAQKSRHILELQYENALQQKELTDLVNRRYHDMKQVLVYLENHREDTQEQERIQQLRRQLSPVESMISTGNEAVDLILGQKLAVCGADGIRCKMQIDGSWFSFMDPVDICALLGNALDNAIEACRQVPQEQRLIELGAVRQGQMLLVHITNPCQEPPRTQEKEGEQVLLTSKEQGAIHGYGIRNMREIMKKYRGQLQYRYQNHVFALSLFFPS